MPSFLRPCLSSKRANVGHIVMIHIYIGNSTYTYTNTHTRAFMHRGSCPLHHISHTSYRRHSWNAAIFYPSQSPVICSRDKHTRWSNSHHHKTFNLLLLLLKWNENIYLESKPPRPAMFVFIAQMRKIRQGRTLYVCVCACEWVFVSWVSFSVVAQLLLVLLPAQIGSSTSRNALYMNI